MFLLGSCNVLYKFEDFFFVLKSSQQIKSFSDLNTYIFFSTKIIM